MKKRALLALCLAGIVAAPLTTHAQEGGDEGVYPPGDRSLDVTAFDSFCQDDAPYVRYLIKANGFTPDPPIATLTITDLDGNLIETFTDMPLEGQFVYPGAKVNAAGEPIDWPGWKLVDGEWVEDPTDAFWRQGINIRVDVNPTAFVDPPISYPPGSPLCLAPPGASPDQGVVPSQPADSSGSLPSTGGGISTPVQIGAAAMVAGALLLIGARRRRTAAAV
jgi:LPXTG-motif cell wall-anchored protein